MNTINDSDKYYKKCGRRYQAVGYDIPNFYPGVATLVMSDDNCTSYWTEGITPDNAAIKAASKLAVEKVCQIVMEAARGSIKQHDLKLKSSKAYREKLERAWKTYCEILGDDSPMCVHFDSHMTVAEKIVEAMFKLSKDL